MMVLPAGFMDFLVMAKRNTYAGNSGRRDPLFPGALQLEFADGGFLYRDIYYGSLFFVGQEVVHSMGLPVWSMSYSGGIIALNADSGHIYTFLKSALLNPDPELPLRGPVTFQSQGLRYENSAVGEIENFYGTERILKNSETVYTMRYSGGLIK